MQPNTSTPRVLIVEPNKNALAVMARRVGEAGYRIIATDSATAAVAELHRMPVALVIAELRMDAMSGIDLVRLIRDDSALRDTPVVLITGRTDANGAVEGFAAGADDVVAKPFHFEVLIARVERRLARARAIRELRSDNATLDARVTTRAIELGEMRVAFAASEAERQRLAAMVRSS
ncbi:MAG: response regulator [Sphingomicrobium sp.]